MADNIINRAAGYDGGSLADVMQFIRTPVVLKDAMYQYACGAKAPLFARSDFIATSELVLNSEVVFPFVRDNCDFDSDNRYQNERPDDVNINITPQKVKLCKSYSIEHKVSRRDKILMGGNWATYENLLSRQIVRNVQFLTDPYFFRVVAAQAAPENIQGSSGSPIDLTTAAGFEKVFLDAMVRMGCNEIICDKNADTSRIRFALPWCAYKGAYEFFKVTGLCAVSDNIRATGILQTPFGFEFHFVKNLPTSSGVQLGLWMDTERVGFPYEWLFLEWNQVKTDLFLSGEMVFDAYALDPKGIGLIYIA